MTYEDFTKMVNSLVKDGDDIIKGLTTESAHLLHMTVGVSGEIGELIENYMEHGSVENRVEELGDIEFYFEGLRDRLALSVMHDDNKSLILPVNEAEELLSLTKSSAALLDAIKKYSVYEKALDIQTVFKEMLNIRHSLDTLYVMYKIDRADAMKANMKKLGKRYSSGTYSNEQAQIRADK